MSRTKIVQDLGLNQHKASPYGPEPPPPPLRRGKFLTALVFLLIFQWQYLLHRSS